MIATLMAASSQHEYDLALARQMTFVPDGHSGVSLRASKSDRQEQVLLETVHADAKPLPNHVSRDGTTALITMSRSDVEPPPNDIYTMELAKGAKPRPVVATDLRERRRQRARVRAAALLHRFARRDPQPFRRRQTHPLPRRGSQ
jgi:hypothetical protein